VVCASVSCSCGQYVLKLYHESHMVLLKVLGDHPCRFTAVLLLVKAPLKRGLSDSGCHCWMNYLGLKPSVYSLCWQLVAETV